MWPFKDNSIHISDEDIFADLKLVLRDLKRDDVMTLVSPYIQFDERVREAILDAIGNGAVLRLLVRAGEKRGESDANFLADHKIQVRELPLLHAKIYLAPFVAMVTSMNLYDFSDRKSQEICVFLNDKKHIKDVADIVERWWGKGIQLSAAHLLASVKTKTRETSVRTSHGFCIRCGESKSFNAKFPLCDKCYPEWAKFKNRAYKENYCHQCGKKATTSLNEPICSSC